VASRPRLSGVGISRALGSKRSPAIDRELGLVQCTQLGPLEVANGGTHLRVLQVESAKPAIRNFGDRFDPHVPISEPLGVVSEAPQLSLGVSEVVAVRIDDSGSEGPIVSPRNDEEVHLDGAPMPGVVPVSDSKR
jgi:hypothetical protein